MMSDPTTESPADDQPHPADPNTGAEALTSLHVRRAADGDPGSLTWIVRRLSPLLLAQADYRIGPRLRSLYEPEDLVNEAWMVALPKLAELPARDGRLTPVLLRFLSTTLLYRIQNLVRKHARDDPGQLPARDDDRPFDPFPDECSGVVTKAVRAERRDAVIQAIGELDERDREILLLRGIEQQSNSTVCMLLGMKKQAVAMRFARALERLREKLPGSVFDELGGED